MTDLTEAVDAAARGGRVMFALRILPTWPWSIGKPGAVVGSLATRAEAEELRREMPNREHYAVVEVPA